MVLKHRIRTRIILLCATFLILVIPFSAMMPDLGFHTGVPDNPITLNSENLEEPNPSGWDESPVVESPVKQNVLSSRSWYWAGVSSLYSIPWGSASSVGNMNDNNGADGVLTEEWDGGDDWRFSAIFSTGLTKAHRYIHAQLRCEFTQDFTLAPEDLDFSICLADSSGNPTTWHYVGQLGPHVFQRGI